MTLIARGSTPNAAGSGTLTRWLEQRAAPWTLDAQALTQWDGRMMQRASGPGQTDVNPTWVNGQGLGNPLVDAVDGVRALRYRPGASAGVASVAHYRSSILKRAGDLFNTDFRGPHFPVIVQPGGDIGKPLAFIMEGWLRKFNNVDPTHAVECFGVSTAPGNDGTTKGAHVGLLGDGVTGYRFGSVSAPDGVGAFTNTVFNAIDANAVQPAALVQPALNWFHVRLKFIPPTSAASPGAWFGYLNGVKVATFSAVANFPRGDTAVNRNYGIVTPVILSGCSDGGAGQQVNGFYLHQLAHWFDEDLTS